MGHKIVLLLLVLCAVIINIECGKPCDYLKNIPEYTRVKRAKYHSNPQRYFKRSPIPYKGVYSFTPPPMIDDEDSHPRGFQPSKVNKRPILDNLRDEDINNFVKYLSKQDLDKIIEAASYKDKYNKNDPYERDNNIYKQIIDQPYPTKDSFVSNIAQNQYNTEFNNPINTRNVSPRIVNMNAQIKNVDYDYTVQDATETMRNNYVSFYNYQMQDDVNMTPTLQTSLGSADTSAAPIVVQEELLPRPVNLRVEEDFDGSFTNNIPNVVKADPTPYQVESFRDLPLMNYNKFEHTVSSYQAPHYTVTTFPKSSTSQDSSQPPSSYLLSSSSSSGNTPPLEPAPPISEAKQQSDAHLKATKIWTARSKGTAYYLHSDGTLSLEKPQRPKIYYSHP